MNGARYMLFGSRKRKVSQEDLENAKEYIIIVTTVFILCAITLLAYAYFES